MNEAELRNIYLIGAGGLASAFSLALAKLYGQASNRPHLRITIIDFDAVERSNLNRQVAFCEADIEQQKAKILVERCRALYPEGTIDWRHRIAKISATNIEQELHNADIVVDASDSAATKFLLNDYCISHGRILCHGAAAGLRGQAMLISKKHATACLRCVFEESNNEEAETCQMAGILGAFVASVGIIQAELVEKALGNQFDSTLFSLTHVPLRLKELKVSARSDCSSCGPQRLDGK